MKLKKSLSMALLAMASVFRLGAREECHNIASNVGTHSTGAISMECQTAAITTRYLLVQKGTSEIHFVLNQGNTRPYGVVADEPAVGEQATVLLLGASSGTMKMVASQAILAGAVVYTTSSGKVSPTFAATAFMVGRAITPAAADGDLIEVAHCFPLINATAL